MHWWIFSPAFITVFGLLAMVLSLGRMFVAFLGGWCKGNMIINTFGIFLA